MAAPRVAIDEGAGWRGAEIEAPTLAESSGARFIQWRASRSDDAALVVGCVATPIPGWVEDMRPAVEARAVALVGAVTSKLTNGPVDARPDEDGDLALRAPGDLGGPLVGRARTFIGFDESRVLTCFATCATPGGVDVTATSCSRAVAGARLEGGLSPPPPGLGLRAATWAVHHPRPVALGGGGLVVLLGLLAVAARHRPRSRIAP